MSIEKRIEKLEKCIPRGGGREVLIKHRVGNDTRFFLGDGPPWKRTIIDVYFLVTFV